VITSHTGTRLFKGDGLVLRSTKKWLVLCQFVLVTGLGYGILCLLLFWGQPLFIFRPTATIQKTPEFFNLNYQEVWIPVSTQRGQTEKIHGWWIPAVKPIGTMLYLHGNGHNIGANINQANHWRTLGFSVLLIDYRGYGKSEGGFPHEAQVYQDAQQAWQYLTTVRKIPASHIVLYGHSLGGAVAIETAIRHPNAAGLIVQSTFTSMQKMVDQQPWTRFFPTSLLLTQRFNSIQKIKSLKMPLLLIHGTADSLIPASMSQELYEAAPNPKQLLLIPGGVHNNVLAASPSPDQQQIMDTFVTQALDR
jgi:uncharacterized protein